MKNFFVAGVVALAAMNAHAEVGVFVGVTYALDAKGGLGLTLQATSSRHEDRGLAAAGVSYYPFAAGPKWGVPVGLGYQWSNAAAILGYDLLLKAPVVSGGYANTRDEDQAAQGTGGNGGGIITGGALI